MVDRGMHNEAALRDILDKGSYGRHGCGPYAAAPPIIVLPPLPTRSVCSQRQQLRRSLRLPMPWQPPRGENDSLGVSATRNGAGCISNTEPL